MSKRSKLRADLKNWIFTCGCVLAMSLVDGCGGSSSNQDSTMKNDTPGSTSNPLEAPAQSLNLRVMSEDPSGNDPTVPDLNASLDAKTPLDDYTTDQADLTLHTKLFLADALSPNPAKRKEYFFVWPEKSFGSPISSATYSHRIKTLQGPWIGNLQSKLVWHDVQNHRWFIPLSDIFKSMNHYGPTDVNLEDTQVMSLELTLESGHHLVIDVKFQASGPLPVTQLVQTGAVVPASVSQLIKDASKKGWVIEREEIVNPTTRPFHLWVRHQALPGALRLFSYLQVPYYTARPNDAPFGPLFDDYLSIGDLEVSQLEVLHQNNQSETRTVSPNIWERVILEPQEKIMLSWVVSPMLRTANCFLPLGQTGTYSWVTVPEPVLTLRPLQLHQAVSQSNPNLIGVFQAFGQTLPQSLVADPVIPVNHSITKLLDWSFAGAQVVGQWSREMRLVHPFISSADATRDTFSVGSSPEHLVLGTGMMNTALSIGAIQSHSAAFACQGVFP